MNTRLPTPAQYLAAGGDDLSALRAQLVGWMHAEVRLASTFAELVVHTHRFIAEMEDAGYQPRLLDEDGESMLAYGATVADGRSVTTQVYWDEDEGPSTACTFHDGDAYVVVAQSRNGGLVEIERKP